MERLSKCSSPGDTVLFQLALEDSELLTIFGMSNLFAWQQKQDLINRKGAIIFAPSVTVKSTPAANGTDLFVLHEGTKVVIIDGSMKDWKEVRLADGKEGWIESKQIRII